MPRCVLLLIATVVLAAADPPAPAGDPTPLPLTVATAVADGKVRATLTNTGAVPITYNGYSAESFQYFQEEREPDGTWKRTLWHWCGTGMRTHAIAPGATVVFTFDVPKAAKPARVGTYFSTGTAQAGQALWFWQSP